MNDVHDAAPDDDARMGFLDHLDELRTRLIRSCIAIALGMVVAFLFVERLTDFVLAPTRAALPPGTSLVTTRLGEGFAFYFDVALIGGLIISAPYVLFQLWRFIAPGLYTQEKRLALPFALVASFLTVSGFLFAHYLLFPSMVAFFATFDSPEMKLTPTVANTFGQYKNMVLAMIVAFQLPTLVLFLARLRIVTARFLWRKIQYAALLALIAAAVLTPSPDPWNQVVLAAPMLGLYVISIGLAWLVAPRDTRESAAPGWRLVFVGAALDYAWRKRQA